MFRWFEWAGFIYGATTTALAAALYVRALGGVGIVLGPDSWWPKVFVALSFLFFLHTRQARPNPVPLLRPSRGLVRSARFLLIGTHALFVAHVILLMASRNAEDDRLWLHASQLLVTMFLASSATMAVSYGICLNNVFSEAFLEWGDPVRAIITRRARRRAGAPGARRDEASSAGRSAAADKPPVRRSRRCSG